MTMVLSPRDPGVESVASDEWVAAMRAGDFARAWEISDSDLARADAVPAKHEGPRHLQRIWRGEPLAGRRVLVRCYHGLGDTIQFARFLSPLRTVAGRVIVWCQPELMPLIATVEGVDDVLPLHDGTPEADFDVDIEIMEIPHAIRATRGKIEVHHPYLHPRAVDDPEKDIATGLLAIGVMWDVGDWDRRRVVPPGLLRHFNYRGAQLYSLQRGNVAEAIRAIGAVDVSTPDINILAARLQRLDLCICPDTMVAHLSAALGRETWVMLHADCDWRWPSIGSTTLWYPTMRLFRQHLAGDWRSAVADVRSAISRKVDRGRGGQRSPAQQGSGSADALA
jgi:hypothetical protein